MEEDEIVYVERKNLYTQQLKAKGTNIMGKLWWSRHKLSKTTKNDGTSQTKLLVAGTQKKTLKNMFKDILNINKTKFNIKENMENYIH